MNDRRASRAFTLIELILVVAISAILIVGLAAVIEVPRQMAEQEQEQSRVSDADRTLSQLQRDVRFASDARTSTLQRLEVDVEGGDTVVYEWSGVSGDSLVRTDCQGKAEVLGSVHRLEFRVGTAPLDAQTIVDDGIVTKAMEAASFDEFAVKPGYEVLSVAAVGSIEDDLGLLNAVEEVRTYQIGKTKRAGIVFQAAGLGATGGSPTCLCLRLQRSGPRDLKADVYKVVSGTQPDLLSPVASGQIANSALPEAMAHTGIPLTATDKLVDGQSYFVLLRSNYTLLDTTGYSALVEYRTLSVPAAATADGVSFYTSDSMMGAFAVPAGAGGASDNSGLDFSMETTVSRAITGADLEETMEIPIFVRLKLAVITPQGEEIVESVFLMENNITLVTQ